MRYLIIAAMSIGILLAQGCSILPSKHIQQPDQAQLTIRSQSPGLLETVKNLQVRCGDPDVYIVAVPGTVGKILTFTKDGTKTDVTMVNDDVKSIVTRKK